MKFRKVAVVAALVLGVAFGHSVEAREKSVKLDELPAAVKATVLEASKGLKLKDLTREEKDGEILYEAELEVDGHIRDVTVNSNGVIVLVEEEVPWDMLPAAVRAAIEKGAEGGKILHVESLTRNNILESYEAHVRKGWRKLEVKVDPEGNPIASK